MENAVKSVIIKKIIDFHSISIIFIIPCRVFILGIYIYFWPFKQDFTYFYKTRTRNDNSRQTICFRISEKNNY